MMMMMIVADERKALNDSIADWVGAVEGREFMGGADPNLADLAVFGTLRAVEGSETHRVIMSETEVRNDPFIRMQTHKHSLHGKT